eukprot:TRINITY_DN6715_c0_g2_i1.p2 TRINITY_DN6715_c0_g2~~TRINITY_DN6715_c0_g2_i1.p2  ORF type:complete len:497 (+),score=89.59 TRINITY_DN6715_c0_g2_i1:1744-3234(+)
MLPGTGRRLSLQEAEVFGPRLTPAPSAAPTLQPSAAPSAPPTAAPRNPTTAPTWAPSAPSAAPSAAPTQAPSTAAPSAPPASPAPTLAPTPNRTVAPSAAPSLSSAAPSWAPSTASSANSTVSPANMTDANATNGTSSNSTEGPTAGPSRAPAVQPTAAPSTGFPSPAPTSSVLSPTTQPLPWKVRDPHWVSTVWDAADVDANGAVSRAEFMAYASHNKLFGSSEKEATDRFDTYDTDSNMQLSKLELQELLSVAAAAPPVRTSSDEGSEVHVILLPVLGGLLCLCAVAYFLHARCKKDESDTTNKQIAAMMLEPGAEPNGGQISPEAAAAVAAGEAAVRQADSADSPGGSSDSSAVRMDSAQFMRMMTLSSTAETAAPPTEVADRPETRPASSTPGGLSVQPLQPPRRRTAPPTRRGPGEPAGAQPPARTLTRGAVDELLQLVDPLTRPSYAGRPHGWRKTAKIRGMSSARSPSGMPSARSSSGPLGTAAVEQYL